MYKKIQSLKSYGLGTNGLHLGFGLWLRFYKNVRICQFGCIQIQQEEAHDEELSVPVEAVRCAIPENEQCSRKMERTQP